MFIESKKFAVWVIIVGLISIVLGSFFMTQGFGKANFITEYMVSENITYTGAGGEIVGIIDTPKEAQVMANVLAKHRAALGSYSSLGKNDPNRQTILNAMTMENSLALAQMGIGLTQVVEAAGAFMIVVGFTFGIGGVMTIRARREI